MHLLWPAASGSGDDDSILLNNYDEGLRGIAITTDENLEWVRNAKQRCAMERGHWLSLGTLLSAARKNRARDERASEEY